MLKFARPHTTYMPYSKEKKIELVREVGFWLISIVVSSFALTPGNGFENLLECWKCLPVELISFYTMKYFIFPRYFNEKKYILFTAIAFGFIVFYTALEAPLSYYLNDRNCVLADTPNTLQLHFRIAFLMQFLVMIFSFAFICSSKPSFSSLV